MQVQNRCVVWYNLYLGGNPWKYNMFYSYIPTWLFIRESTWPYWKQWEADSGLWLMPLGKRLSPSAVKHFMTVGSLTPSERFWPRMKCTYRSVEMKAGKGDLWWPKPWDLRGLEGRAIPWHYSSRSCHFPLSWSQFESHLGFLFANEIHWNFQLISPSSPPMFFKNIFSPIFK